MAEYIFYTNEGFAQAPAGNDVENCQLIGRAFGDNVEEARKVPFKFRGPWT